MESLWKKIDSYLVRYKMLSEGDYVLAAVSGGVDSMCMLHYLLARRETLGIKLAVFHFNHHLRDEAGKDAKFVEDFCKKNGVPCKILEGNVHEEAIEKRLSIEETARVLRYNAMFDCASSLEKTESSADNVRIVLAFAHNAGDRAETVLFRLFRGTGLKGIRGIEPVSVQNGYKIIRPLLECSRENIERCVKQTGSGWVEDKTNSEDNYTRNKVRHHILGYAKENINEKAIDNICRAAADASEAYDFIATQARCAYEDCISNYNGRTAIDISDFLNCNIYLQKHILLYMLEQNTVARKDLTSEHIDDMLKVIRGNGNKCINLPYGLKAVKEYGYFYLEKVETDCCLTNDRLINVADEANQKLEFEIKQEVFDYNNGMEIPTTTYTKWLDYDKIQNRVEIRNRRKGDYLYINDNGNRISLKKYFINEKIPPSIRENIVLVADGSHILWIVGHRISAAVKITANTKKILALSAIKNIN